MSSASNLGYNNQFPYNTSPLINGPSTTYSGNISSNEVVRVPMAPLNMNGGKIKRKIKNIVKQYKTMKAGSRKCRSLKRSLISHSRKRRHRRTKGHGHRRNKRRSYRGGTYSQYQMPPIQGYQTAGVELPNDQIALANPAPIKPIMY
jgi:hypothetical protein